MRVFKLNSCDWWMAATLEQAIADYKEHCGVTDDEVEDPRELTDEELDRLIFIDGEQGDNAAPRRPFREQMALRVAAGATSEFFASTEY